MATVEEVSTRSRKKSLNACLTCRRRHIRCDNAHPACKNCTKHNRECKYGILPLNASNTDHGQQLGASSDDVASTGWGSDSNNSNNQVDTIITAPSSGVSFRALPVAQHKLFHHLSSIAETIETTQASNIAIYMKRLPTLLTIACSYEFVMHSLVAWAASHLAFSTNTIEAQVLSRQHRLLSMQGLREAISTFNEKNSDAVLSASLLLSWQAADPREWAVLNKGTSSVIAAMQPWYQNSLFSAYIEEDAVYRASPNAIIHPAVDFLSSTSEASALRYIYGALHRAGQYAKGRAEETLIMHNLMKFVANVQQHIPIQDPALRFYLLEPTRSMLFWYPVQLLQKAKTDPVAMVVLAHLFAVSLTVQPVFAGPGAAHFRGLSTTPIEEIYQRLQQMHNASGRKMETFVPLSLMYFPLQAVALFRSRMGLDPKVVDADQSLTSIRYGLDPLVDAVEGLLLRDE